MNNILITGCNGQLGLEIKKISSDFSEYNFFFTDVSVLDITDYNSVEKFVSKHNINIIINCAAYTQVDKAESSINFANDVNHLAVLGLSKISKSKNIKLIHISTDYVFDGNKNKAYLVTDTPNPQTIYGKTKLEGEFAMQKINPKNSIIIRTSWLYSKFGNNFFNTMLNLSKIKKEINIVSDQIGSPTNAGDLAKTILTIIPKIKNYNVELYHYSNCGECSWYEFAKAIFKLKKIDMIVNPINTDQFPTIANRPRYSVLDTSKIEEILNVNIPDWKKSLRNEN